MMRPVLSHLVALTDLMAHLARAFCILVSLVAVSGQSAGGQDTYCRGDRIPGCDAPAARAKRLFADLIETRNATRAKIYVSAESSNGKDFLYIHTNYRDVDTVLCKGVEVPSNPVKIAYGGMVDDLSPLMAQVFESNSYGPSLADLNANHVEYYVDRNVLDSHRYQNLSIDGAATVFLVENNFELRRLIQLRDQAGRLSRFIGVAADRATWIFSRVADYGDIAKTLRSIPFKRSDLSFVSLVVDERTKDHIDERIPSECRLKFDARDASKLEFYKAIRRCEGKLVVALGHIEGDRFVVREGSRELYSISLSDLEQVAVENQITLLAMGCNSGAVTSRFGIAQLEIDSRRAVDKIAAAIDAGNLYSFFEKLSSEDFRVVVDENVPHADRRRIKLRILRPARGQNEFLLLGVAFIFVDDDDDAMLYLGGIAGLIGVSAGATWWLRAAKRSRSASTDGSENGENKNASGSPTASRPHSVVNRGIWFVSPEGVARRSL